MRHLHNFEIKTDQIMLSRETESNYRTADPSLTSQPSSTSGNHMSVAAKAGEMQIFSSDFLS